MAEHSTISSDDIRKRLLKMESPFIWDDIPKKDIISPGFVNTKKRKSETITDENEFKWTSFALNLVLAYELCETNEDPKSALQHIDYCEDHLVSLTNSGCKELLFKSIQPDQPVLWHVTRATKAHIHLRAGQLDQAIAVLGKIRRLNPKKSKEMAGIYGVKAAFAVEYGAKGQSYGLESAKKARDLDPEQAEWHCIVGLTMGRLRRINNSEIDEEEMKAVERAFLLQKDASYVVYLAQLYSEYSSYLYFNYKQGPGSFKKSYIYANKALDRLKEAIAIRPDCISLKARVAHTMLRIRFKNTVDVKYLKNLLDEVLKKTPNNRMIHHDMGLYYNKFEQDVKKSMHHLQIATEQGNVKALSFLMFLKWRNGLKQQIIDDLEGRLTIFKNKEECLAETLAHLGVSYLLIKNDWSSAVLNFNQCLEVDPSAKYLENYNGFECHINILEAMANEIRLKISTVENPPPEFQQFLDKTKSIRSNLFEQPARTGEFKKWKLRVKQKQHKKPVNLT